MTEEQLEKIHSLNNDLTVILGQVQRLSRSLCEDCKHRDEVKKLILRVEIAVFNLEQLQKSAK